MAVKDKGAPERPGGFEITGRGIALCRFPAEATIADIGCGNGDTLRYLREKYGYRTTGVDIDPARASEVPDCPIITADGQALPFADGSLDGLLFECSMSKMERPDAVLSECARVLKSGGKLMVSDLYARGEEARLRGKLGRLERQETILSRSLVFGFEAMAFEDYSRSLTEMWARLVFENGPDALYNDLGADAESLKRISCGYYLAVYRKSGKRVSRVDNWTASLLGAGDSPGLSDLRAWQLDKIQKAIEYSKSGGFYGGRFAGIDASCIRSFADFEALPFTGAQDLSDDPTRFLAISSGDVQRIVTQRSSGTTGDSKRLYFSQSDIQRTEEFFTYALSDYVSSGKSAAVFMSGGAEDGIGDLLRRALRRIGVETAVHGNISDYSEAARASQGRAILIGAPAEMLRLCRLYPELSPKVVLLSADYIPESVIRALKSLWGCAVIRHFGMAETCFGLASDCAAGGGQHIRHADFYVEIVDPESGTTLPFGQPGEIVVTALRSEAAPLIRYRTGDLGSLESGSCSCGGIFPRLGRVLGRLENLKHPLNIHALDELLFSFSGVLDYEAELSGAVLSLYIDGSGVDAGAVEQTFGVKADIVYRELAPRRGKRKLKSEE